MGSPAKASTLFDGSPLGSDFRGLGNVTPQTQVAPEYSNLILEVCDA